MQLKRFQLFVDSDAAVTATHTTENTEISHNFIMWKFCGKAQFPQSFGRIARNSTETVLFGKISTPGN